MGALVLDRILVEPLKRINVSGGDVLHGVKRSDIGFQGFGEAYFSMIEFGAIKAWKMHKSMTLNLVAPIGLIKFIFMSDDGKSYREEVIGDDNYARIAVPPGIWFGFKGLASSGSLLLNIANIEHDPAEVVRKDLNAFTFDWGL